MLVDLACSRLSDSRVGAKKRGRREDKGNAKIIRAREPGEKRSPQPPARFFALVFSSPFSPLFRSLEQAMVDCAI